MVITIRLATDPFILPEAISIMANIPITVVNANVAPANLVGSSIDRAATAPAITAIATVITTRFPTTFSAPLVAAIIAAITRPNTVTAARPFLRPSTLIILIKIETAANKPIAMENARIVPATFAVC